MFKGNKSLLIVVLIAVVNMLGYGIIIPILYAYSKKFGLSDFQNGLLFSTYSICQFVATPIIGRLSDKFGRRPMLLISVVGTALSFFMMAIAPNYWFLFLARALDGLTAGNIPVVFAVISDTTKPEERPRAFGLVGAAFSFGLVFGPAVAALTIGFGSAVPFLIAGTVTLIAATLAYLYLPETNKHMGDVPAGKLFDFKKMTKTLFDPNVGVTFFISLLFFLAFSCAWIYGFQPFTMNILKITQQQNVLIFTFYGMVGLFSQTFLVARVTKLLGMKKAFSWSFLLTAIGFMTMYFSRSLAIFIAACLILGLFTNIAQTLITTILSRETDAKSQGSIMGLNASYQSVGMMLGPILGGVVATLAVPLPFAVGAILILVCFFLSFQILRPGVKKESAY